MRSTVLNRKVTTPLRVPRTRRQHEIRVLTSLPAGKMVPIAAIPLLREDSATGVVRLNFEMMETVEILMNAVNVDVKAYLVPHLAFERFQGSMDILNRSYEGQPPLDGEDVVPYYSVLNYDSTEYEDYFGEGTVLNHLGLHGVANGGSINMMYIHAYNQIWNHRAANRSPDINLRTEGNPELAAAFWKHQAFAHIVPDFDQAAIDGEVPLSIAGLEQLAPVLGDGNQIKVHSPTGQYQDTLSADSSSVFTANGSFAVQQSLRFGDSPEDRSGTGLVADLSAIVNELNGQGISISLANIEVARKTQAFARLRQQYEGHTDEWLIGLLMDGIHIPDQALKQPMLIGQNSTIFGMAKRYASDSGNLTESVVSGLTSLDIRYAVPRITTGGVIMIVAEITPDQLWERKQDPMLNMVGSVDDVPQYLRDTLDPEKVSVVENQYVDIDHNAPTDTFGYAPLNHEWNVRSPRVGGRFYRPQVDETFDEDRQRIWAVETANPTLSTDFYLTTQMHTKPFVVQNQDPFECVAIGNNVIEGNTVFGGALIEATDSYDKVLAEAPMERIEKPAE